MSSLTKKKKKSHQKFSEVSSEIFFGNRNPGFLANLKFFVIALLKKAEITSLVIVSVIVSIIFRYSYSIFILIAVLSYGTIWLTNCQ